ncbi:MAG: hypothetical protein IJK41_06060 [Muribaculaceae bacterium]|nr:hypothetical protein [Muribaculaceae bacterium]
MSTRQPFKRFVLLCLLALLPVFMLVALYVVKDPFHVVKPYQGRVYNPGDTIALTINWGHVTIESYKYFDPEGHFDSFIFGSSLSGYYRIKDWKPYLPADARPFHFNASRETLNGILNKLNYLTSRGVEIKNALIIMEDEMLRRKPLDSDVLFVQHPATAREVSWWNFHQLYFNAFRRPELVGYLLYPKALTQTVLDKGYATTDITNRIENINEGYYAWADSVIAVNPSEFFTPEHIAQYSLPLMELPCPPKVNSWVAAMLRDIAHVLKKQGTEYHIIIPPHYGYEAIDSQDLYILEDIFGENRVHDYSHDPELGSQLCHYYDDGHLIAQDCARLIDSAYHAVSLPSPYLKTNNR